MITAVDSNVLIDVMMPDPKFGERSREALRRAFAEGRVVACEVVWAETYAANLERVDTDAAFHRLGVVFDQIDRYAAVVAGEAWRRYRQRGGSRERMVADFLIGAHATRRADRLLTRDQGFYREYFRSLRVLDPTA